MQTIESFLLTNLLWNENKSQYLDTFIPLVSYVIIKYDTNPISTDNIKNYISKDFNINIPQLTLDVIFKRMVSKNLLFISDHKLYQSKDINRQYNNINRRLSVLISANSHNIQYS
ncbi:MAG: hypothetical protein GX421_00265 [Caldisericales bacterium]|nr:hypothetical protein [Caldisericales bacterium]